MTAAVGTRRFSDSRTLPGFEKELPKPEPRQAEPVERGAMPVGLAALCTKPRGLWRC